MSAIAGTPASSPASAPLGLEAPLGNPRYPLFDGLRALAAVSVFAYHFNRDRPFGGFVGKLAAHGDVGVVTFFLISGFLLYRPFVTARLGRAPAIDALGFYGRRVLRIVPAYWLALTVLAIYPGLVGFGHRWWQMYAFGQIYDPRTDDVGIRTAWSLCIEVTFYAILPLYAFGVAKLLRHTPQRRWLIVELSLLAALSVLSLGYHTGFKAAHDHSPLPGTFYLFAAGMGLASITVAWEGTRFPALVARYATALWVFALCFYVALSAGTSADSLGAVNPVYAIVGAALLLPATVESDSLPARFLRLRAVAWVGLVSYAVYLWSRNVLDYVSSHIASTPVVLLVTVAVTLVIAALSYYLVEARFLRLKSRLAHHPRPTR